MQLATSYDSGGFGRATFLTAVRILHVGTAVQIRTPEYISLFRRPVPCAANPLLACLTLEEQCEEISTPRARQRAGDGFACLEEQAENNIGPWMASVTLQDLALLWKGK
jgi:hypothetical protein